MEIKNIKKEFPIFKQKINGKPLVYLDSANSSQKPKVVIDKISNFYETEFSNVGRSVHTLAVKATNRFEAVRDKVKQYINAKHREEIIFTKGATEGINLVSSSFGKKYINKGESNLNFKPRPRWPLDPNANLINPIHKNIGKSGAKA